MNMETWHLDVALFFIQLLFFIAAIASVYVQMKVALAIVQQSLEHLQKTGEQLREDHKEIAEKVDVLTTMAERAQFGAYQKCPYYVRLLSDTKIPSVPPFHGDHNGD